MPLTHYQGSNMRHRTSNKHSDTTRGCGHISRHPSCLQLFPMLKEQRRTAVFGSCGSIAAGASVRYIGFTADSIFRLARRSCHHVRRHGTFSTYQIQINASWQRLCAFWPYRPVQDPWQDRRTYDPWQDRAHKPRFFPRFPQCDE